MKLDPSDLRTFMQIVIASLENDASLRIVSRELALSEEEIDRLYELAEQTRKETNY